jgi:hypothetical protein
MRGSLVLTIILLVIIPAFAKLPEDRYWYFGLNPSETSARGCHVDFSPYCCDHFDGWVDEYLCHGMFKILFLGPITNIRIVNDVTSIRRI